MQVLLSAEHQQQKNVPHTPNLPVRCDGLAARRAQACDVVTSSRDLRELFTPLSRQRYGAVPDFVAGHSSRPLSGGLMDRRMFLKRAAVTATAAVPFTAFLSRAHAATAARPSLGGGGYGPLAPMNDETTGLPLLMLPAGFRYVSFGWTGDPLDSGTLTPGSHDGMAAYRGENGLVRLVRNHERGTGTPFSGTFYDAGAAGGTTTLTFDPAAGALVSAFDSLSGTIRNCAGGPTPWGSWLTCEETTLFTTVPHGYVFDVPADGFGDPEPIRGMGRFSHEAVAVDRRTGYIYETEDAGTSSGFYRYVPARRNRPSAGGKLYMLKVVGVDQANLHTGYPHGTAFGVEWVPIHDPDSLAADMPGNFVWSQGRAQGAATFGRLEGCWYGNDRKIYVVSTNGGAVGQGQIWVYDPADETISLLFESPDAAILNAPDNITVSPRGGLVLCEDGNGEEFMHGLTVDGEIFQFAKNNVVLNGEKNGFVGDFRGSEWAGACFSPDGEWLFANAQSPGITFAITGPWRQGGL
jgi:secreted PhoX family phosphatase